MCLALFVVLFMARAASLDLVCGDWHNCVFERGQEAMKCWGRNDNGQLGYDDTNNRGDNPNEMGANLTFVHIGTGFVVEDMKLGFQHTCAKSVDRAMKCFGWNAFGMLGFDGVTTTGDALPFLVFGADFNLSKIAVGSIHTCALSTDAALKCFGYNNYGQCGTGTNATTISGPPSQLSAIDLGTNFTTVDVQTLHSHVCVKSQQGTAKCFGWNDYGQLGYGDTTNRGQTPESMGDGLTIVYIGSDFTVAVIATGAYHSCALSTTKAVKCWGCGSPYNYGQCGTPNSTETGDDLPVLDLGVDFVPMQLALGEYHTCILSENALLICFGRNNYGQLGIGHTNSVDTPSTLTGIDLGTGFVPRQVAAGFYHNCAVSTTDAITCWGYNNYGQLGLGHANNVGDDANEMGNNLSFVDVDWPTTGPTTATPTTAAPTTEEPTTAVPTTPAPTTAAPTADQPTTATPTTASPTTPAPSSAAPTTTEVTTRAATESETTDAAASTTPAPAHNNSSSSNHTVTIRSDSLSSTQILIAIANAQNLSSTPLVFTTLSSDDDGFATVELLVAVPSNVELDYDVIKATLREAMVDEYGEDVHVDIDVDGGDADDDGEGQPPSAGFKSWVVVLSCSFGACFCFCCIAAGVVYKYRQRKRVNAPPPQRQPSQPQPQAPHAHDDNACAGQIENPGAAPELAMARVVSHSASQVVAPGAANDDDEERKRGEEDVELAGQEQKVEEQPFVYDPNRNYKKEGDRASLVAVTPGIPQVTTFVVGAEENSDSEQLYDNDNNNNNDGTRNPTPADATPAGTPGATVGHDPKLGVYELKHMVDL